VAKQTDGAAAVADPIIASAEPRPSGGQCRRAGLSALWLRRAPWQYAAPHNCTSRGTFGKSWASNAFHPSRNTNKHWYIPSNIRLTGTIWLMLLVKKMNASALTVSTESGNALLAAYRTERPLHARPGLPAM
jgi:hypothetical protein